MTFDVFRKEQLIWLSIMDLERVLSGRLFQKNKMIPTILWILLLEELFIVSSTRGSDESAPFVQTSSGSLTGVPLRSGKNIVDAYLGIPFAEPPIGRRRFQMPSPVTPWEGTLRAVNMSAGCVQTDFALLNDMKLNMSDTTEDCLYLNVWVPRQNCLEGSGSCSKRMPVFVFLYGGLFNWGSSSLPFYDGLEFAARAQVIYVSFNYRVGILGFLNASNPAAPGNMGLYDQVEALRWIQKNIKFFGGDPDAVTLAGQSAGAVSVGYHMVSKLSERLFKRAVLFSGTPETLAYSHNTDHRNNFRIVGTALNCVNKSRLLESHIADVVDCLRQMDAHELTTRAYKALGFRIVTVLPGYGDPFLPSSPIDTERAASHVKEVFLGTTEYDGAFIVTQVLSHASFMRNQLDGPTVLRLALRNFLGVDPAKSAAISQSYFDDGAAHEQRDIKRNLSVAVTDAGFECSTTLFSSSLSDDNAVVYRYLFVHRPSYSFWPDWLGATHADELPFFLGTCRYGRDVMARVYVAPTGDMPDEVPQYRQATEDELRFSDDLISVLSAFCHTG